MVQKLGVNRLDMLRIQTLRGSGSASAWVAHLFLVLVEVFVF